MYLIASIIAVFLSYMNIITTNKHAYHDYRILQTRDAGIVLHGHEVKSLRVNRADISKGIVTLSQKKCKLTNLDIRLYNKTSPQMIAWYDPQWARWLLLKRSELAKIQSTIDQWWCKIIPLQLYFDTHNRVKVKIGIGILMKKAQKKQVLKEKEVDRQAQREIVSYSRHSQWDE